MSDRAVVVGFGIGGIAAAAALRRAGREVLVVERDVLPSGPAARPGVPQGNQLHNLLTRAQMHLERLLPGFGARLREAGAGDASVAVDTEVLELGVRMPRRDLGMRLLSAPRPLIEHVARDVLSDVGGVEVRTGARVGSLLLDAHGGVAGVDVDMGSTRTSVGATLVVDATGARAEGIRWLRACGLPVPSVDAVRVSRWYSSATFERTAGEGARDRFWMIFPKPPGTRGGIVAPVGPDRWYVSLSGCAADAPPRDAAEMCAYARTLDAPWIAQLLAGARALEGPTLFRRPLANWRRYDLLERPLPGLLPLGDSFATLDPLFGQGISVAAWQASALGDALTGEATSASVLTKAYLSGAASACAAAWELSRFANAQSADKRSRAIAALLRSDAELHRRYVQMWHLVEPVGSFESTIDALFPSAAHGAS